MKNRVLYIKDIYTITMTSVLTFGKYRNQTIQEVYAKDFGYARWLLNQDVLIGDKPEIKAFLSDMFHDADSSFLMTWGKHKRRTIKWVYVNDRQYFNWLINNKFVIENCKKLKTEIDDLVAQKSEPVVNLDE